MSNHLAIASVTATLRQMLDRRIDNVNVTVRPPDRAAGDGDGNRLNLFLYQTVPNAAWRNMDMPGQTKPGERGNPPLALNLLYLLTVYGPDAQDSDITAHRLLGSALSVLHDHNVLGADDIRNASQGAGLETSDLDRQAEHVSLNPVSLSPEEMSKLWSTFQTQYRLSTAFEASVVLIESQRQTYTALPVLARGKDDSGIIADTSAGPQLLSIEYRATESAPLLSAAEVGHTILVKGSNLTTTDSEFVVRNPQRSSADDDADVIVRITPTAAGKNTLSVTLPTAPADPGDPDIPWSYGPLSLEFEVQSGGRSIISNSLPLLVAPTLQRDINGQVLTSTSTVGGRKLLTVSIQHALGPRQRTYLLLNSEQGSGSFQLGQEPDPRGLDVNAPNFDVTSVPAGRYRIRLRVDGVDSLLMHVKNNKMEFDSDLTVTILP